MAASTSRCGGVAVGILAGGERLRLLPPVAAGDVGEQLEQHVGRGAERHAVDQHVAQRAAADREVRRRGERRDHGIGERGIIGGEDAEGVADGVVDAGAFEIELDVPGLLLRARLIEACARQEARHGRGLARASRRGGRRSRSSGRRRGLERRCRRLALAKLPVQRLEHAGGFLATGHAEIQPLFFLREDGVGIVLTGVSALSAVLLSHCRHHPPVQRTAFGELHAIGERHGRVVPGRVFLILGFLRRSRRRGEIEPARKQRGRLLQRQWRDALLERKQPREQAVEPDALLGGKRRALRDERGQRCARRDAHSTASLAMRDRSASISCRRVNAWKLSCGDVRCAR